MLMFDRISHICDVGGLFGKGEIRADLEIKPDLWFFKCHFKDDPVMPGCLGLDALWQMVGFFLGWMGGLGRGRALGVDEVKFTGMVLPTAKKITYIVNLKRVIMRRLVMGIVVLFVVFVDWGFLGIVLPRIPEGGSIYFGTSRSAYAMLQPVLIAGGLAGTGLVLWDLFFRRP